MSFRHIVSWWHYNISTAHRKCRTLEIYVGNVTECITTLLKFQMSSLLRNLLKPIFDHDFFIFVLIVYDDSKAVS